jgi:hypothetical protein
MCFVVRARADQAASARGSKDMKARLRGVSLVGLFLLLVYSSASADDVIPGDIMTDLCATGAAEGKYSVSGTLKGQNKIAVTAYILCVGTETITATALYTENGATNQISLNSLALDGNKLTFGSYDMSAGGGKGTAQQATGQFSELSVNLTQLKMGILRGTYATKSTDAAILLPGIVREAFPDGTNLSAVADHAKGDEETARLFTGNFVIPGGKFGSQQYVAPARLVLNILNGIQRIKFVDSRTAVHVNVVTGKKEAAPDPNILMMKSGTKYAGAGNVFYAASGGLDDQSLAGLVQVRGQILIDPATNRPFIKYYTFSTAHGMEGPYTATKLDDDGNSLFSNDSSAVPAQP